MNHHCSAGLQGTYRLFNEHIPYWFREVDSCDSHQGLMRYQQWDGQFTILDTMDYWTVAACDTNLSRADYNFSVDGYHPELCQGPWETLVDGSLENYNLVRDDSVSITLDKCSDYHCIDDEPAPDTLCLSKNSVLHSFLEGTYVRSGVVGADGSVEYVKEQVMWDEEGNAIQPHLYYWYGLKWNLYS